MLCFSFQSIFLEIKFKKKKLNFYFLILKIYLKNNQKKDDANLFMTRQQASDFMNNDDEDQDQFFKRLLFGSGKDKSTTPPTTTTKKPKHDPEEVREIEAKTNARRKKAYKNYEDACKVNGKFTVRTCPKIEDCFARNKLKFIPVVQTPAPTTARPGRRELIEREEASSFFDMRNIFDDDESEASWWLSPDG